VTDLETTACDLCGSVNFTACYRKPDVLYHKNDWFTVVQCSDCGLGFVNPRPTPQSIDRYYPNTFFDYFEHDTAFHTSRYARESAFLKHLSPVGGRNLKLLDIGCANGGFPRYVRDLGGWDVEGVEVAKNAPQIKDFKVYRCPLPQMPLDTPAYDAITAWAVLEHVHSPMAYFRKISRLLKPNGVFVFLVTNFESISSRYLFCEDIPRHLHFFSKSTIRQYLQRTGMVLKQAYFNDAIYSMRPVNWLYHYIRRLLGLPPLTYTRLPQDRRAVLERMGLGSTLQANVIFAALHPLSALDRLLLPVYEKWQILRKAYGIITYVAGKLPSPDR
jgi:SAM-dependent methyltransferase